MFTDYARERASEARAVKKKVTRLRVFAAVKAWMVRFKECPNAAQVAAELGVTQMTVLTHMRALVGADGLPLPITFKMGGWQTVQESDCARTYVSAVDVFMERNGA